MERYASIDIGSNSAILLIAEYNGSLLVPVQQKIAVPRLGRNLQNTGLISEESFQSLLQALIGFQLEMEKFDATLVGAVATQAFRAAGNVTALLEKISTLLGLQVRILSGQQESELSYAAVANRYAHSNLAVLDIGGGSIELQHGGKSWSLPLGAVSLMEAVGKNPEECRQRSLHAFDSELGNRPVPMELVVVGGTAAALAMLELKLPVFDSIALEGLPLSLNQVTAKIDLLRKLSATQYAALPGMDLGRMDILIPGLCLLESFLKKAACSQFTVSDRGVRYGVILEWLGQHTSQNRPVLQ